MNLDQFDESALTNLAGGIPMPSGPDDMDTLEASFSKAAASDGFGFSPGRHWKYFKAEMIIFICGPAPNEVDRHATLRKDLSAGGATTETAVVGAIAALIATHLGVTVEVLVPFVAIFLAVAKRKGAGSFCETCRRRS